MGPGRKAGLADDQAVVIDAHGPAVVSVQYVEFGHVTVLPKERQPLSGPGFRHTYNLSSVVDVKYVASISAKRPQVYGMLSFPDFFFIVFVSSLF